MSYCNRLPTQDDWQSSSWALSSALVAVVFLPAPTPWFYLRSATGCRQLDWRSRGPWRLQPSHSSGTSRLPRIFLLPPGNEAKTYSPWRESSARDKPWTGPRGRSQSHSSSAGNPHSCCPPAAPRPPRCARVHCVASLACEPHLPVAPTVTRSSVSYTHL